MAELFKQHPEKVGNVYKTEKIIDTHSGIPQMALELCKTIAEEMFSVHEDTNKRESIRWFKPAAS